ncbi:MAG: S49 family peptidase [Pseudomonadota bacterium]
MSTSANPLTRIWRALPFTGKSQPLVTVIELSGVIGVSGPGRKGLSFQKLEKAIESAFKPADLDAVALAINSPGGSPVQSRLIFSAIRRLAKEKDIPVLSFIEDVGASGGYILAIAGDEIYADDSSVVGSIGVISGGFGFQEAISRLGIERRVYTAGENKAMLDPFKPEDAEDVARLREILDDLHAQFIDLVKSRRPDKITDDPEIFSGAVWTGPKAREKGLIDGTAQLDDFLRARYGKDVKIKRVSPESGSLLKRLLSSGDAMATEKPALFDAEALLDAAERRALWARFGL